MINTYVLDANALLTYFGKEPGVEVIRRLMSRAETAECLLFVHAVNAYELYYQFYRDKGEVEANELWADIHLLPVRVLYTLDENFILTAGHFKATFSMSVADSFLLAQAHLLNAEIVTSDHHELDVVDKAGILKFYWFR